MGSSASVLLKDGQDVITLDTRWDGFVSYTKNKINAVSVLKDLHKSLSDYVKDKEDDFQITFLKQWINSIHNFIEAENSIEKAANLLMFGDFVHYCPSFDDMDVLSSNDFEQDYIIEKEHDEFILFVDKHDYKDYMSSINKAELNEYDIVKTVVSKNKKNDKKIKIEPKNISENDLLIRVYSSSTPMDYHNDESNIVRDKYSVYPYENCFIKMKNGSREKLMNIITTLPMLVANLLEIDNFSLKAFFKEKNLENAFEVSREEYNKKNEELNKKCLLKNTRIVDKLNSFSSYYYYSDRRENLLMNAKSAIDEDSLIRKIESRIPLDFHPEKLIVHLATFYPDLFETLTVSELRYISENKVDADMEVDVLESATSCFVISMKDSITEKDYKLVENDIDVIKKGFSKKYGQDIEVVGNTPLCSYNKESKTIKVPLEMSILSVMKAYDKYQEKLFFEGLKKTKKVKPKI